MSVNNRSVHKYGKLANPECKPFPMQEFKKFEDFYPYYLGEHSLPITRRFHLLGTTAMLSLIAYALAFKKAKFLPLAIVQAYVWAWLSHFWFEQNKPATWTFPLWSARGDLTMWAEVIMGRRPF